jgi:hypothetical protein
MDRSWMTLVMLIPLIAVTGGLINAGLALHHRARLKELALRERIALIERGLTPPPEVDPAAFDREWDDHALARPGSRAAKNQTAGVILIGLGLGLMLLISLTSGETNVGIGVGGGIAILGAAFLVNGFLRAQQEQRLSDRRPALPRAPNSGPSPGSGTSALP